VIRDGQIVEEKAAKIQRRDFIDKRLEQADIDRHNRLI
jgi:hypothetical protein